MIEMWMEKAKINGKFGLKNEWMIKSYGHKNKKWSL